MSAFDRERIPAGAQAVLEYWIGDADRSADAAKAKGELWFEASQDVDAEISRRFTKTLRAACAGELADWALTPEGRVAEIIVLDQFPRNMFRGTPEAFASDERALEVSMALQSSGWLERLGWMSRVFALMPMQHAEDLTIQERSVDLFESLAHSCESDHRPILDENAKFARLHRDIVRRFGRFPHRNRVLGRDSTEEERRWLEDGAPTFGQGG